MGLAHPAHGRRALTPYAPLFVAEAVLARAGLTPAAEGRLHQLHGDLRHAGLVGDGEQPLGEGVDRPPVGDDGGQQEVVVDGGAHPSEGRGSPDGGNRWCASRWRRRPPQGGTLGGRPDYRRRA